MKKWISIAFFIGLLQVSWGQNWLTDFNLAIDQAKEKNLPILIYFSGSDWCAPCIKLSKTVFETNEFETFSKDSLILLKVDFPKRKSNQPPPEELVKRELLAETFNPSGAFPSVVIIDHNENVIAKTEYRHSTAKEYILHLKSLLQNYPYSKESTGKVHKEELLLMGSRFELAAIHQNKKLAQEALQKAIKEIERIESLISSWNPTSETSLINQNAGIKPVQVSTELYQLIKRSLKVSQLTNGAFDISFASISPLWKFDETQKQLPDSMAIAESVQLIDFNNIVLNDSTQTVYLKEKGMRIGFGAIGKGYAANKAKQTMVELGIENGMINAGGDLIAWGDKETGENWKIGIADPTKEKEYISWLVANNSAIVTSGDYEKFVVIDGIRYAHIIDPRTGYPTTGIKSVTIVCPDAELADALATAVFVMGEKKGLSLINQMKQIECLIINDRNEMITSEGMELIKTNGL